MRIAKGLSQTEVAELAGASQSIVSNFESGNKNDFYFSTLLDFCGALETDPVVVINLAKERAGVKVETHRRSPDDFKLIETINRIKLIKPKHRKALLDHIDNFVNIARKDK
jgi:transcriptional regulator with XRE-family HTH domain